MWLLAGWAVFWLSSVIPPCCQNLAFAGDSPLAAAALSGEAMGVDVSCASAHDARAPCHAVSVAQDLTPEQVAAVGQVFEPALGATAFFSVRLQPFSDQPARFAAAPPSLASPLYLRLQRLLI